MNLSTFYYNWPSWITELLSGLCCAAFGVILYPDNLLWIGVIATALSITYERFLDQNGWSWTDVAQRQVGILLGVALWIVR